MNGRINTFVKEAVLDGVSHVQRQWMETQASVNKTYLVLAAIAMASVLTVGAVQISGGGSMSVMQQRLFGQLHLSTGTYSARTLGDLNAASWENGLVILETLDALNSNIRVIEGEVSASRAEKAAAASEFEESMKRIRTLLKDRKAILKSARALQAKELYAPVYHEYLRQTMEKAALVQKKPSSESLVNK